jgi:hypothetical protein
MHRSKLPLNVWFWAAHLMTTHSNGISALQLAPQIGLSYRTAWLLTQKLRRSMVDPDRSLLSGLVEVDQTEIPFRTTASFFNPALAKKIIVIGAVEVVDRATGTTPRKKAPGALYLNTRSGRVRLGVIPDNTAASIHAFVRASAGRSVPITACAASTSTPIYLNEFVFRFNRHFYRHISFEKILGIASRRDPIGYWDIVGRRNPRKGVPVRRMSPRLRKTTSGMKTDGAHRSEKLVAP